MHSIHSPISFCSHRLETLVKQLYIQIEKDRTSLFDRPIILIPNGIVKEWIQLECSEVEKRAVVGWDFFSWRGGLSQLLGKLSAPTRTEMMAALWARVQSSPPMEWKPFLGSERKKTALVSEFGTLFSNYLEMGLTDEVRDTWQGRCFYSLLDAHGWKTMPAILKDGEKSSRFVYLFAVDWMPPAAYQYYSQLPNFREFRFSPTAMYWEDLRSAREQKRLIKWGERKKISEGNLQALEELLQTQQPLLANWGVLGRNFLSSDSLENYELARSPKDALSRLQADLLEMEKTASTPDRSIRLLQTGPSRMREIEVLRDEIEKARERGIAYSDIRIYAPEIAPYAPIVQFVFGEQIPFRIEGVDLARQSSYFQAINRLFTGVEGRWSAQDWAALVSCTAFAKKQGWQSDDIEQIREWIRWGSIRWGLDPDHQQEQLLESVGSKGSGAGTWEEGLDRLTDSWIYFDFDREWTLSWSDGDLFQSFLTLFSGIKKELQSWKEKRTLREWVDSMKAFFAAYLAKDDRLDEDRAAHTHFQRVFEALKEASKSVPAEKYPFAFVKQFLFASSRDELNSSLLHAVRFCSMDPGAMLPAKMIFVLGMDEESYPRSSPRSNQDLMRKKGPYFPTQSDWDRYLFLQLLFAAREELIFSYSHRSKDDGKLVSPSLLIQELISSGVGVLIETPAGSPISSDSFLEGQPASRSFADFRAAKALRTKPGSLFHSPLERAPVETKLLSLRQLCKWIGHPFRYYLTQVAGIEIADFSESKWSSFELGSFVRHSFLRDALFEPPELVLERLERNRQIPVGMIGEEVRRDLIERATDMRKLLSNWGISMRQIEQRNLKDLQIEINGTQIEIVGEAPLVVPGGVLYLGEDAIGGVLRNWPELLAGLSLSGGKAIHFLRSGKVKEVADPLLALHELIELYLKAGGAPFLLHSEWADALLRKEIAVEKEVEDRVLKWVLDRSVCLDLRQESYDAMGFMKHSLASLAALYPTRKSGGSIGDI